MNIEDLKSIAATCELCELHKGRINPVFDKGNPKAKIFICGMVPAEEENKQGIPFVGRAGRLLDQILKDSGLTLEDVYITNLVKCFLAPGLSLEPAWVTSCIPFLLAQLETIRPKVIITLGLDASRALLPGMNNSSLSYLRKHTFNFKEHSIIPTYHPSFLLRKGGKNDSNVYYKQTIEDFRKGIELLNDL